MPETGIEPVRSLRDRRILSPVRLPVPPLRHKSEKNKSALIFIINGGRRIRTFEVFDNRFTVCPLWPLGNPSIYKIMYDEFKILRKEVIQPHLPIRLPCYDFTPVIGFTFDGSSHMVRSPASGAPDSHGVTGGVYKTRERIHRDMLIRDY